MYKHKAYPIYLEESKGDSHTKAWEGPLLPKKLPSNLAAVHSNLTQHIEDGYERKMSTGAAFVDLSAAYDTVQHRLMIRQLMDTTGDIDLCQVIRGLLSNRRFFVQLNDKKSRWRSQKNGLPQGSVLAPLLFNIYTNDQPLPTDCSRFIYADDLCITTQQSDFQHVG